MKLVCFLEGDGDLIREEFWLGPVDRLGGLVVIAPARRAGDPGSNPSPGKNFSLKLLISTCQMVILKVEITFKILPVCVVNIKTLIKEMPV